MSVLYADVDKNDPTYLTISQSVHENLLTTDVQVFFLERKRLKLLD